MKRKISLLIALLLLLGTVLCSCRELDEKRARRADFSDDHATISYLGNRYVRFNTRYNMNDYYATMLRIATKDVPLLLVEEFGTSCMLVGNGELIWADGDTYCLEEEKDYYEKAKLVQWGIISEYYWGMNKDAEHYRPLPADLGAMIDDTIANGEKLEENLEYYYNDFFRLARFDERMALVDDLYMRSLIFTDFNGKDVIVIEDYDSQYLVPEEYYDDIYRFVVNYKRDLGTYDEYEFEQFVG